VHIVKNDEESPSHQILYNDKGGKSCLATKATLAEKAKKLLAKITKSSPMNIIAHNIRRSAPETTGGTDPSEVPIAMATKFPATMMTLSVVSKAGNVMPSLFPKRPENLL
jgi:hypothetical protein